MTRTGEATASIDGGQAAEGQPTGRSAAPEPAGGITLGRVGVVDIGSNTVRLVVYDSPTRLPIPVFNEKALCRLGEGLSKSGRLSPAGVEKALRALRRFVGLSRAMGVQRLELVATAAVRDAADGPDFVHGVEAACGQPVHVLSGAEEARLAAVGVLNGSPEADGALADLGGGSLDLVGLAQGRIDGFATLPLGHIRLAEESGGDHRMAREILARSLASVPWLAEVGGRSLYCVGGSWRALARIFIDQMHHPLHVVDAFVLDFFHALRLANLLAHLSRPTLDKLGGVDSRRLDSLPFAAAAMEALLETARPKEIVFSAFGMREGQMLELLPADLRGQDPLISACESQAERTGRFAMHGAEICDWMTPLFPSETRAERRLRLAACLLSDIGWSEHPDYRALHAFHRVLRVPYPGLAHPDRAELAVAILIRYGGVEDDPMVTPVRSLLDEGRLTRARIIGPALRLAQTLSGGAPGLLPRARLRTSDRTLFMTVPTDDEVILSEAVERRFNKLARATGLKGEIVRNGR